MCEGNFRRHHSGHILNSVSSHLVSIKEHNAIHHSDGNSVWKRKIYELDDIN